MFSSFLASDQSRMRFPWYLTLSLRDAGDAVPILTPMLRLLREAIAGNVACAIFPTKYRSFSTGIKLKISLQIVGHELN